MGYGRREVKRGGERGREERICTHTLPQNIIAADGCSTILGIFIMLKSSSVY